MNSEDQYGTTDQLHINGLEQALAAKDAEIERLDRVVNHLSDSWRKDEIVYRELRAALNRNKIETQYMNGVLEAFPRHDHPLYVESQALDARIRELEEALRVLGKFFYEASGGHGYSAIGFSDAIDAVLANPLAAKAVEQSP